MTVDINAAVAALEGQVGYHEGPNNLNIFLEWQTDGVWKYGAWCIAFGQWGIVGNGGYQWPEWCQWGVKGDSYCPYAVKHAKDLGIWVPKGAEEPQRGWGVLYSWGRNGVADHYETWEHRNTNGTFITIAGNVDDQVKYKLRDETFVMGYIKFEGDGHAGTPQPIPPPSGGGTVGKVEWPTLSTATGGSQAMYTKVVQDCEGGATVDGVYGKQTRSKVLDFQRRHGLQADGVVGNITATAVVQVDLNFLGFNAGGVDGICGPQTTEAIKAFQRARGITDDGIFGPTSTLHLCAALGI